MTLFRRKGSSKWYGEYTDSTGRRVQKSTRTTIKRDAQAILAKWQTESNNHRHGIAVAHDATIDTLLNEYIKYVGKSEKYLDASEQSIRRIIDACGMIYPRDIDRIAVETTVRQFKTPVGEPISLRTQGSYFTAIKSFTRWLVNLREALPRDPLAGIKRPNPERDRKRKRRYLLPEEWHWLSKTPNSVIYETAIATGLRASELRSITANSLQDDHIYVDGRHTKNGDPAKQYVSRDLLERLAKSLPLEIPIRTADLFRQDLQAARELWLVTKPKKKPAGFLEPTHSHETLDFHALRHTCGAWLAIAGVSIKVIQSVMRHSTITLTLDTYGHLLPGEVRDAAERLSVILSQSCARSHPIDDQFHKKGTYKESTKKRKKP